MKDRLGNEIEVGTRVAYNLSGDVAVGRVERMVPGYRHSVKGFNIFIRPEKPWEMMTGRQGSKVFESRNGARKVVVMKCSTPS